MRRNIKRVIVFLFVIFLLHHPNWAATAGKENYLLVWTGDQSRKVSDFLTILNFDDSSPDYGKVITTLRLPDPGSANNEPHHVGLSADGKIMAAGGLLSVLSGQKEIFFFDVSDPRKPRFLSSADPPQSAITDEFYALAGGGFLVTMMGGAQGHHPGRIAEFDKNLKLVAEHPQNPPEHGFNPHGISVRPELNLMVTSDFICPSSTLASSPGELELRGSVRVWDYNKRQIVRTIDIPEAGGTIDVQMIPGDRNGRAFTAGMISDKLYLIDTKNGTATAVFDFATIAKGGWPQLIRMTRNGKRLFISMNQAGRVAMLDTTNPAMPKLIKALDLGKDSGPHY
ncbi:MAG TPA: selenium-binding protein SBP56-related protein, partial [Acidobacteriota bacterium]|nr:selenium-binding protein SBP56-related protein [Acidobacteriota bacterium]